ncbi:MAG: carboxypeptidase M32 [Ignisphaera sp.]|nr:carboxypeptidase M32 [Ignisphaera sp.]
MVFQNPVIKEILEKYRVIWSISHALNIMEWDSETYMPREGYRDRAVARAELELLRQQLLLRPEFVELVEKADKAEDLNDYERGVVRVLKRAIRIAKALPPWLVAEKARVTQEAMVVWREAKARNDFEMFRPYLEKIFDLSRKTADYLGWDKHPYDALLDLYEEGLKTEDVDRILGYLRKELKWIIDKVLSEGRYPQKHPLEDFKYDPAKMEIVNKRVLEMLGYPLGVRGRLDVSAHPFTINMGIHDVRITTRYEGIDFKRTLFSVIHEFGHALYELQIDPALAYTPVGEGVSLGIHEGQSRFWENIVGRSREFVEVIYPILKEHLDFVSSYSPEDLYLYFNTVRPSLIRVDADEVTYNMHIVLRAEIEKLAIAGEIKVSDIPEYWNRTMEELLGIRPKTYSEGVLQDIHWSMGSVGYFPTYTLGNIVAAMMRKAMIHEIKLYEKITNKDFAAIREWQREKIHRYGAVYAPRELLKRSLGKDYSPEDLIEYLRDKYLK